MYKLNLLTLHIGFYDSEPYSQFHLVSFFQKGIFNTIATILIILGIIAHIGMATIDFVIWSYGNNFGEMNNLIFQLKNKPSIWISFMTVGPSLPFVGLSIQAWKFIRTNPIRSIMTIIGSIMIGLSSFLANDRIFIVLAFMIFTVG